MIKILCMSFVLSQNTGMKPPEHIQRIMKHQIHQQFERTYEQINFLFDENSCPNRGQYTFKNEQMILKADHPLWSGELSLEFNQLLGGKKLRFDHMVLQENMEKPWLSMQPIVPPVSNPRKLRKRNRHWLWIAGGVAAGLGLTLLVTQPGSSSSRSSSTPASLPTAKPAASKASSNSVSTSRSRHFVR